MRAFLLATGGSSFCFACVVAEALVDSKILQHYDFLCFFACVSRVLTYFYFADNLSGSALALQMSTTQHAQTCARFSACFC